MKALALVQTQDRNVNQLQQNIKQAVDPLINNPISSGNILYSVSLASGANSIPHLLNRTLQGWFMTRVRASATFYDTQDSNQTPQLTLNLVASGAAVVDIYVF